VGGDSPLVFVKRLSIKEIVRRTGHGRNTIRRALRAAEGENGSAPFIEMALVALRIVPLVALFIGVVLLIYLKA
jgi:hypothetical protein